MAEFNLWGWCICIWSSVREKGKTSALQHDVKHRKDINSFNNAQRRRDFKQKKQGKHHPKPPPKKVPDTFSSNKNSAPCEVKLDTAVQSICSAKHKKANPFLGSKEGVRCIQKAHVSAGKGSGDCRCRPTSGAKTC